MIAELSVGLQIALLLALGYLSRRCKVVGPDFAGALSRLLIAFFLPCVVVKALLSGGGEAGADGFLWALVTVAVIVAAGLIVALPVARRLRKGKDDFGRVLTAALLFTNFTYMGIPVTEALYGAAGVYCVSLMSIPMRLVLYTTLPLIFSRKEKRGLAAYGKILASPPIAAVFLGLMLSAFGVRLAGPIESVVNVMASACTPLGMMLCGMLVAEVPVKTLFQDKRILLTCALRLALLPALVLLALHFLPVPRLWRDVAVIFAALPVGSIVSAYAAQGNIRPSDTAAVIVLSTLLSLASVPAWAWLLARIG